MTHPSDAHRPRYPDGELGDAQFWADKMQEERDLFLTRLEEKTTENARLEADLNRALEAGREGMTGERFPNRNGPRFPNRLGTGDHQPAAHNADAALREAVEAEVARLEQPKGLHRYEKGLHRPDCEACKLLRRLRSALRSPATGEAQ